MPKRLINFRINTIGSVDRPACGPALVALVKRRLDGSLSNLSGDGLPEGDDPYGTMNKRKEEGNVFFIPENIKKNMPADLVTQFDELAKKVPTSVAGQWEEFHKSLSQLDELKKQAGQVTELQKKADGAAELQKQLDAANVKLEQLEKNAGGSAKPEDLLKKLDGEAKALVESLMKKVEDSDKLTREALEKADKERDQRVTQDYIAKASTYKALPVKPSEFGLVLKSFGEHNKEMFTQLEAVLKAADELVAKSKLMDELGTSREGTSTVWAEVEKRADTLVKNGICGTKEQAISKVFTDDQALYKQYREEAEE